jgi:hypothetical protein
MVTALTTVPTLNFFPFSKRRLGSSPFATCRVRTTMKSRAGRRRLAMRRLSAGGRCAGDRDGRRRGSVSARIRARGNRDLPCDRAVSRSCHAESLAGLDRTRCLCVAHKGDAGLSAGLALADAHRPALRGQRTFFPVTISLDALPAQQEESSLTARPSAKWPTGPST